jgi:N-acetyl-gamma-glutamyl-phosphate/LysW-gamma-L-alpha-aminoadipyl-6-phosphate reductase
VGGRQEPRPAPLPTLACRVVKRFKAAVIGGSGYGGGEMIRRLLLHPEVELVRVASLDYVGEPLGAAHPNLEGRTDLVFQNLPPEEAAAGVDVVLLGLPHKVSAEVVPKLMPLDVRIVDMSGDFRLKDAAVYEQYYGKRHPAPELLKRFVYGLPELNREALKKTRFVASPGCFATTIELGLLPLAREGLLQGMVETVGITGSSGSGVVPSAGTHHPVRHGNLKTYKPLSHQHVPEIVETLTRAGARNFEIGFVPVSAPLSRGIFATSFVRVPASVPKERIEGLAATLYASEPFVRVPRGRLPEVVAVAGSNFAEVAIVAGPVDGATRLVTCFSASDNLIKGGAGQAIQNMNLVLGLDERAALEDPGGYP